MARGAGVALFVVLALATHRMAVVQGEVDLEQVERAFAVDDDDGSLEQDDPVEAPPPEVVHEDVPFTPCDPDDYNPTEFAGRVDKTVNDIPNPGCPLHRSCTACLAHRTCGWCATHAKCVNTRSTSPECAFNENTDVCAPPCEQMWHVTWPVGRQEVVTAFCDALATAYRFATPANSTLPFTDQ